MIQRRLCIDMVGFCIQIFVRNDEKLDGRADGEPRQQTEDREKEKETYD